MENGTENPLLPEVVRPAHELSLPASMAAKGLHKTVAPLMGDVALDTIVDELAISLHMEENHPLIASPEAALLHQSKILDALFLRLVDKANAKGEWDGKEYDYIDHDHLIHALHAQRHCRMTVCSLRAIQRNANTVTVKKA